MSEITTAEVKKDSAILFEIGYNIQAVILLFAFSFKIVNDMKVFKSFGFLAELIESSIIDVAWFMTFFAIWVWTFASINIVLSYDVSNVYYGEGPGSLNYYFL